jgi:hypothetical protein
MQRMETVTNRALIGECFDIYPGNSDNLLDLDDIVIEDKQSGEYVVLEAATIDWDEFITKLQQVRQQVQEQWRQNNPDEG